MADLRIVLPAPCGEDWNSMSPAGCNRHCATCNTTIHDLEQMTLEQAEALLDSGEKACVRARVRADGEVLLAAGKGSSRRRMIAAVGASLTLATAACQTAPFGHVSPRFEVSGETQSPYWSRQARLQSSTGKTYSPDVAARGNGFRFSNLPPGTYTLSVPDMCGEPHRKEGIVVRDSNVDVGLFDFSDGQECIIIGVMSRDEGNGYG